MKNISEFNKSNSKKLNMTLRKSFMIALKDTRFVKLVNSLKVSEDVLIKYTSRLERTVEEIENCKNCKGLSYCKNRVNGYVNFPKKIDEDHLSFDYVACKYEKENLNRKDYVAFFETPKFLREAKMKDIFIDDKNRIEVIKYVKNFLDKFGTEEKIKGLYLHGSFGSGKSYIINALINELGKKGVRGVSVYYPNLLKMLKDSFGTSDFERKFNEIMTSDVLLIDDIGAENNTLWSRDEVLGTILQYRMDNDLSTFFTSNLNLEELEDHLKTTTKSMDHIKARRIIERIKQLTIDMELITENKRK